MFLYSKWQELPLQTRHKIAAQFNIPKRGPTEVFDNQIKSDGYPIKEIEERLNVLSIADYLDTKETDMSSLWSLGWWRRYEVANGFEPRGRYRRD